MIYCAFKNNVNVRRYEIDFRDDLLQEVADVILVFGLFVS